jgi:hypothetical protein
MFPRAKASSNNSYTHTHTYTTDSPCSCLLPDPIRSSHSLIFTRRIRSENCQILPTLQSPLSPTSTLHVASYPFHITIVIYQNLYVRFNKFSFPFAVLSYLFVAWFTAGPWRRRHNFPLKILWRITDYMALYPRSLNSWKIIYTVRFEVFTAVTMKNVVFWDIKPQFVLHWRHVTSPLQSPAS